MANQGKPDRGLCLLSLDGGGVGGLSILLILQSILKHVRQKENELRKARKEPQIRGQLPKPCQVFDLIGGTNTGGIIALMLGRLEMSIEDAIERFIELTKHTFSLEDLSPENRELRTSALEAELKELVSDETGSPDELLTTMERGMPAFVCARSAFNLNAGKHALFRTYHSVESVAEECTIWQAACATSSTPEFFDPVLIGRAQPYIDGGLGCNNPTKLVLSEAAKLFPKRKVASIISIGAGHPKTISLNSPMEKMLGQIAEDCESTHEDISRLLRQHDGLYHRFNVEQVMQDIKRTDFTLSAAIEAHTNAYILGSATRDRQAQLAVELLAAVGRVQVEHLESVPIMDAGTVSATDVDAQLKEIEEKLTARLARNYQYHEQGKQACHPATRDSVLRILNHWIRPPPVHSGDHHVTSENASLGDSERIQSGADAIGRSSDLMKQQLSALSSRLSKGQLSSLGLSDLVRSHFVVSVDLLTTLCCWITGVAGVGKTAIAITIVECLLDSRTITASDSIQVADSDAPLLCAHYFFNHTLDSANIELLIPTIALQLARRSPAAAAVIQTAINQRPSLITRFDIEQARSLLLEPFCALAKEHAPRTVVVIIDALDELQPARGESVPESYIRATEILGHVAEQLPSNARLLILSRPQSEFLTSMSVSITRFHLDTQQSNWDVRRYFEEELPKIGRMAQNPQFPSQLQLDALCSAADGHLGWAQQAKKWLFFRLRMRTDINLDALLDALTQLAHGDLVALYRHTLTSLPFLSEDESGFYLIGLQRVLRCIAVLESPQSIPTISQIIGPNDNFNVRVCLEDLRGLFADGKPRSVDEEHPLQPHKSFYDFLLSKNAPVEFHVDPQGAHSELAAACRRILYSDELHFNMGNLTTLQPSHNEIKLGLSRIPKHVQYAACSFMYHTTRSGTGGALDMREWNMTKLLSWFEVILLLEQDRRGQDRKLFKTTGGRGFTKHVSADRETDVVKTTFDEQLNFPLSNFCRSVPIIYTTALPFTPNAVQNTCSSPHVTLLCEQDGWIKDCYARCAISPNGEYVAVLSQFSLHVLSSSNGALMWPAYMFPNRDYYGRLKFSDDATAILVAILTQYQLQVDLYLLEVTSGDSRAKWKVKLPSSVDIPVSLSDVQLSPGGIYILISIAMHDTLMVCVYQDGQLLWHAEIPPLSTAKFLNDDVIILQEFESEQVYVVNCRTGEAQFAVQSLVPEDLERLYCIVISSMGSVVLVFGRAVYHFAQGLHQMIESEAEIEPMHVADEPPRAACFSPDGHFLVLGLRDGSIQLWQLSVSGRWNMKTTLCGHLREIKGLAFLQKGTQVISYSDDRTVRIWDITAIVKGREWEIKVPSDSLVEGNWFKDYIPLGGWFTGGTEPKAFLFQYPFQMPEGVEFLQWKIESRVERKHKMSQTDLDWGTGAGQSEDWKPISGHTFEMNWT